MIKQKLYGGNFSAICSPISAVDDAAVLLIFAEPLYGTAATVLSIIARRPGAIALHVAEYAAARMHSPILRHFMLYLITTSYGQNNHACRYLSPRSPLLPT